MKHSSPTNIADAVNIRTFLQQAIDHYPRLVAFSFTLALPYRAIHTDYRSLILRFHSEVWQRTGEYSWQRQQARRSSPPTLLRWIWASTSAPQCKMVLLLNLDTLVAGGHIGLAENVHQAISEMLREAWLTVTGAERNGVTDITPIILNRSGRGTFTTPFNQLTAQVKAMATPLATARTGVTCH
ncbi:TPA: inovirus-type Gp2 protein [Enterobacter ludwigii]